MIVGGMIHAQPPRILGWGRVCSNVGKRLAKATDPRGERVHGGERVEICMTSCEQKEHDEETEISRMQSYMENLMTRRAARCFLPHSHQ